MEKNYDTCAKCKYDDIRHCANNGCAHCELYDGHCKCVLINDGEDCPYFVGVEEVDE